MKSFEWMQATSLDDAIAQLGPGVVVKAGGVDLHRSHEGRARRAQAPRQPARHRRARRHQAARHAGRARARAAGDAGADRRAVADVRGRWPALAEAVRARGHAADPQHGDASAATWCSGRAAGTSAPPTSTAGRRAARPASPSTARTSSTPSSATSCAPSSTRRRPSTALVAYGATVTLTGKRGRARAAARGVLRAAGEGRDARERARRPTSSSPRCACRRRSPATRAAYHKQVEKESFDWPIADVAVVLRARRAAPARRASIVLGAAAPVPWRAKAAEAVLDRARRRRARGRSRGERGHAGRDAAVAERLQAAGVPRRHPPHHPRGRRRCRMNADRRSHACAACCAPRPVRRQQRVEARRVDDRGLLVPGDDGGVRRRRRLLPSRGVQEGARVLRAVCGGRRGERREG